MSNSNPRRFSQIQYASNAKPFSSYQEAKIVADEIGGTVEVYNGYTSHYVVKYTWLYFNGFYEGK